MDRQGARHHAVGAALLLALGLLLQGVTLSLPPGEEPAEWATALELTGFELTTAGAEVRVEAQGRRWAVFATDEAGRTTEIFVVPPRDAQAREDLLWLLASLRAPDVEVALPAPRPSPEPGPEPTPERSGGERAPRPALQPPPEPAIARPPPAPAKEAARTEAAETEDRAGLGTDVDLATTSAPSPQAVATAPPPAPPPDARPDEAPPPAAPTDEAPQTEEPVDEPAASPVRWIPPEANLPEPPPAEDLDPWSEVTAAVRPLPRPAFRRGPRPYLDVGLSQDVRLPEFATPVASFGFGLQLPAGWRLHLHAAAIAPNTNPIVGGDAVSASGEALLGASFPTRAVPALHLGFAVGARQFVSPPDSSLHALDTVAISARFEASYGFALTRWLALSPTVHVQGDVPTAGYGSSLSRVPVSVRFGVSVQLMRDAGEGLARFGPGRRSDSRDRSSDLVARGE